MAPSGSHCPYQTPLQHAITEEHCFAPQVHRIELLSGGGGGGGGVGGGEVVTATVPTLRLCLAIDLVNGTEAVDCARASVTTKSATACRITVLDSHAVGQGAPLGAWRG